MNDAKNDSHSTSGNYSGILLVAGISLAAFADAVAGTASVFGRLDMLGDFYTTSDEFAWLDFGYTAAKLAGFMAAPQLFAKIVPLRALQVAVVAMTVSCALMSCTIALHGLVLFRVIQGVAGGIILVGGQSILFQVFRSERQPLIQGCFVLAAVIAPATFAPAMQGWLVDALSWVWIFLTASAFGASASIVLAVIPAGILPPSGLRPLDISGFFLFLVASTCLTYVAQQGSRWNWFDDMHITVLTLTGFVAILLFAIRQIVRPRPGSPVNPAVFNNQNFCFGFMVSFVVGISLFGSSWLIPGFTLNVLGFTATEAGALMIPGSVLFIAGIFLTAFLIGKCHFPSLATIPLGILLVMAGVWMLSCSTSDSGGADMAAGLLVRSAGLGFLSLALPLYALGDLKGSLNVHGVALFSTFRQMGGLVGVALLQRYMDHLHAQNRTILASHLTEGGTALTERLQNLQSMLLIQGIEPEAAANTAIALMKRAMETQVSVLAYNEAFFALALVFVAAAPLLAPFKAWLAKHSEPHVAPHD